MVSLSSLILNTNNIVICIYQTITYNLKTTNSEQVAYLRNLNYIKSRCVDFPQLEHADEGEAGAAGGDGGDERRGDFGALLAEVHGARVAATEEVDNLVDRVGKEDNYISYDARTEEGVVVADDVAFELVEALADNAADKRRDEEVLD